MEDRLNNLLDRYLVAEPDELETIDAEIWDTFGDDCAVFVLDMSGFTRITQEQGIVRFMALRRLMHQVSGPVIDRYRGTLIKYFADNLIAIFERIDDAVEAATAMHLSFRATNVVLDDARDVLVSIGIDTGRLLRLPNDLFGGPVNLACKLGEDLAAPGETLITRRAFEQLATPPRVAVQQRLFQVSGTEIDAVVIERLSDHDGGSVTATE